MAGLLSRTRGREDDVAQAVRVLRAAARLDPHLTELQLRWIAVLDKHPG